MYPGYQSLKILNEKKLIFGSGTQGIVFGEKLVLSKPANFCEKGKAIALVFGEKLVLSKAAYFSEKGKGIALVFGEKLVFSKSADFSERR